MELKNTKYELNFDDISLIIEKKSSKLANEIHKKSEYLNTP